MARLGGAAVAGIALAVTAMGSAAFAENGAGNAATGIAKGSGGLNVRIVGEKTAHTTKIVLGIGAHEPVTAFCIDFGHPLNTGAPYIEETWQDSKVNELAKIKWVLNHSIPKLTAGEVAKAANVDVSALSRDQLEEAVYAGTQVAIWSFSDGRKLDGRSSNEADDMPSPESYKVVQGVYEHLTGTLNVGDKDDPQPTLKIDPVAKSGAIGGKAGPFTVQSGEGKAKLAATGGKIVDKDGKAITELGDDGKFWLTSDDGAKVTVTAEATGMVPSGRVFVVKGEANKFQKIILAGTAKAPLKATSTATFTNVPSPSASSSGGSLPVTGASVTTVIGTGLVLLVVGGGLAMLAVRRRRIRFTA